MPNLRRGHHRAQCLAARTKLFDRAFREGGARPALEAHIAGSEVAEYLVEFALVVGDHPFGCQGSRFGERRTFSGVVAALELAVGSIEVVRIKTAVVCSSAVI